MSQRTSILSSTIRNASSSGGRAMGVFVTCGYPTKEDTSDILDAIVAGGADFVELGMPFSDPLAEGIPIQRSSEVALEGGTTLALTLEAAASFSERHATPLLLMGYYNPILQYGVGNFCRDAVSSGVSGFIIPDLPPEEAQLLKQECESHGLDLVFLIAPNSSPDRIRYVDSVATGFVYAVSTTGVTGGKLDNRAQIDRYLEKAAATVSGNPVLVGFGIRTRDDAVQLAAHTDGFIVGSAVILLIEELWKGNGEKAERLQAITDFVDSLRICP